MAKVTVTIEDDFHYQRVIQESDDDEPGVLLARCVYKLADASSSEALTRIAEATHRALNPVTDIEPTGFLANGTAYA